MQPLVTVVLAVYNGEKYLEAAIQSLLAQTYSPIEIVIIDDGSTDGTAQIAQKYASQTQYFFQPNQGQPAAQNRGVLMARGDYITFLDADDLYSPDKTALQVERLEKNPHADMVFGHVEQFLSPDVSEQIRQKWYCPSGIFPGYLAAAGLFRQKCFERVGLFNQQQKIGLFIDWYMRAQEAGLISDLIAQKVLRRRIHGNNITITHRDPKKEYFQIVKAALQRRSHANVAR